MKIIEFDNVNVYFLLIRFCLDGLFIWKICMIVNEVFLLEWNKVMVKI